MAHHRCSVCKQEAGIRHKVSENGVSFLACDTCLARMNYTATSRLGFFRSIGALFSDLWNWATDTVRGYSKRDRQKALRESYSANTKANMRTAKRIGYQIPVNPASVMPQKR